MTRFLLPLLLGLNTAGGETRNGRGWECDGSAVGLAFDALKRQGAKSVRPNPAPDAVFDQWDVEVDQQAEMKS